MKKLGFIVAIAGATALTASASLFVDSFESGISADWITTLEPTAVATITTGLGVTDGSQAVSVTHADGAGEVPLLRINNTSSAFWTAFTDPTATGISVDVSTTDAVTQASWSQITMRLQGSAGTFETTVPFVRFAGDQTISLLLDLASIPNTTYTWGQVTIAFNGQPIADRSPLIVDNFRVIPEPATIGLVGLAGIGLIAVRRFKI